MKTLNSETVGFIGLGLMGKHMARNLRKAGIDVTVFNRSKPVLQEFQQRNFKIADSIFSAAQADITICMVSNTAAVEEVLFGRNGVYLGIKPGSIFIDMGTTEVNATREFAKKLSQAKVDYVDAPVSGGEIGASEATLSIMVGAHCLSFERVRPILEILGKQVIHVGNVGSGQIAKAANQVIVGLTIGAIAEAFALARDGGVDLDKVWQALSGGFADSRILQLHGRRMIEESYEPGGTAVTQHKDLVQALMFAETTGTNLPATKLCRDLYKKLIDQDDGHLDHSALFRVY